MNLLFGKINMSSDTRSITAHETLFNNGVLDIEVNRINVFEFDALNYFYNEKSQVLCAMIGYCSNLNEIKTANSIDKDTDVEVIEEIYTKYGFDFGDVDGLYTILIWDKGKDIVLIFQDDYGSSLPLYYSVVQGDITFCTSLKKLIYNSKSEHALNTRAAFDFLYTMRIVPNENTLIKGIYKLLSHQFILADLRGKKIEIKTKSFKRRMQYDSLDEDTLLKSIEDNIIGLQRQSVSNSNACALSGGYDTNFILGCLARNSDKKIHAFTVGGKAVSEIPSAAKCAGFYENVEHLGVTVQDTGLNSLPDIVWRYDGYVSQSGIFLTYDLAKAVANIGAESIYLGENADYILDSTKHYLSRKFEKDLKIFIKRNALSYYYYRYVKKYSSFDQSRTIAKKLRNDNYFSSFNVDFHYILRKSTILLNSYNITGIYPFINQKTIAISNRLGNKNTKKRYYKEKVKEFLGPDIADILVKIGGSTDIDYLFDAFEHVVDKLLGSALENQILSKTSLNKIKREPMYYREMLLTILYLHIFNELFISEKYKNQLNQPSIKISLSEMFQ